MATQCCVFLILSTEAVSALTGINRLDETGLGSLSRFATLVNTAHMNTLALFGLVAIVCMNHRESRDGHPFVCFAVMSV